jgi:hypothetical protein
VLAHAMGTDAWTTVGRLLGPPGALARAFLPLLLTVAVLCFFASNQLGPALQVASGVLLAGLVWLLVRGDGTEIQHERANVSQFITAVKPTTPFPPLQTIGLPLLIGVVGAVAFAIAGFGSQLGTWKSAAGWSGVAEYVGLLVLALATVARLFGYATNRWRVVVALAFALLTIRALTWAGVLSGEDFWRDLHVTAGGTSFLLAGVIVAAFSLEAWVLGGSAPAPPGQTHRFGRALGFLGALTSAGFIFAALFFAGLQTTGGADRLPEDQFGPITPTLAPAVVNTPGDEKSDLAWTFAPVLHLQHDEEYPPVGVEAFLAGSTESGAKPVGTPGQPLSLDTLPTVCPDGSHQPCGTLSCPKCIDRKRETQPVGFVPQGVFYARVAQRVSEPDVFVGWNPWGEHLTTLIQYWIFYAYDRWQAETVIGRLTQEHEGDWEHVSIGLDDGNKPLFVALSAHCGGQVVDWDRISAAPGRLEGDRVVPTPGRVAADEDVTHPIVAVAKGSHANYAVSAGHRPPDWGSCKNLPSDALSGLSYASNVRDLTEDGNGGWFAYPEDVQVVNETSKPMSYPGAWGSGEDITFAHREPVRTSHGPFSPPLHPSSWGTPIRLYFCSSHWHGDRQGTKKECSSGGE